MSRDPAYDRARRRRHNATADEAARSFTQGDPTGLAPLLPDGTVDVRAQLTKWDTYFNRGTKPPRST